MLLALLLQVAVDVRHEKSWRGTIDGHPLLVLRGDAVERGRAQGLLAGKDILQALDAVVATLQKNRPGAWDASMLPLVKRFSWPPRFERELEALVDALPVEPLPSLKRKAGIDDLRALNCLSDLLGAGCSSFAAWGDRAPDGAVVFGRNADYGLFPILKQMALVARVPSEKEFKPSLELTILGNLGASSALNGDGAFLALHDEEGLPGRRSEGWIPRTIALREGIETAGGATAVEEVANALRQHVVKVGNNVLVGGPGAIPAVLEWDGHAKGIGVTIRRGENGLIACTNHYVERATRAGGESRARYERLLKAGGKVDFEKAKELLASVAKSGGTATYLSVVVWPASKRYAFAVSPELGVAATKGKWVVAEWEAIFNDSGK